MAEKARKQNSGRKDLVQLTRRVGALHYGQTMTRKQAEAAGLDEGDIRDLMTDRAMKPHEARKG